jgi:DNA (cytosine-5)-methyltransferase 1
MQVLDLFSGIGGFSLGLERAGMSTVAFCEIDKKCHKVLKKHWPDVPIFDDVTTLTKEKLNERSITVDVICGGFPCQDLSVAGTGKGLEGSRSGLWFEYGRIISELRPRYVIVENVSALLNRGFDQVLGQLAQIGYDAEWHCIPASAVGAPHRRDRIWIIAYPNTDSFNWRSESQLADNSERKTVYDELGWVRPEISNSNSSRKLQSKRSQQNERRWVSDCSKKISDTMFKRLERQRTLSSRISKELSDTCNNRGWATEPDVGRVAHGVPNRVDRLKQLGNSIVPQIAELIGRAIMDDRKPS